MNILRLSNRIYLINKICNGEELYQKEKIFIFNKSIENILLTLEARGMRMIDLMHKEETRENF